ncbi:MAG: tetratricopeptide repeat protein [Bacteroidales bacterium]
MKKFFMIIAAVMMSAAMLSAQDLSQAVETYNNGASSLMAGDKTSALNYFQQALTLGQACGAEGEELVGNCKNAIPGVILSIGKELFNNKDINGAIAKVQEAAKTAKEYGVADVEKEANELLSQMKTLDSMNAGNTALTAKNFTEAAKIFKEVLAADTTNANAAIRLGQALTGLGDADGAIDAYKHAAYNGQMDIAKGQIANVYLKKAVSELKAGKYAQAITSAETGNTYEDDAQSYLIIGQANQKLGKNSNAIEAFEKYVSLKPTSKNASAITYTVAALYQQAGNKAKAIENYKKILSDAKFGATAKQMVDALSK